jgi:membrane fusion protein (multidrug efflux system)
MSGATDHIFPDRMKLSVFSRLARGIACLALAGITGSLAAAQPRPEDQASNSRPIVNVVTLRRAAATAELVLPASLIPLQEAALYARTTGYLQKRLVDIGDRVTAGQTLAVIDSPEVDQQFNQAQAALGQARANAELAAATATRWQGLIKQQAVSQQDAEEKVAAANAARASVQAAEAEVARLAQMKNFCTVVAPFDGVVSTRGPDIGALITPDANRTPLFRIVQQTTLRVYANIPQAYVRTIRPGLDVDVLINEFPGRAFGGKVTRIAGALDAGSRTLQAEVQLPNEQGELLPGMYAQLRFRLTSAEPLLLVPSNAAIIRADGKWLAVVENGNRIKLHAVEFGRDFGAEIEIRSGLAEGTRVVANPSDFLTDGLLVEVAAPPAKK